MQSSFVLCLRGFAFLIVDLTFHGQWHIFRVRRQPLCSGSSVCPGSKRSLANLVDATVEVVLARSQKHSPKLRPISTIKAAMLCVNYNFLDSYQRPWSKTVLSKDCAVQKSEAANL